jgi:hypothetical protein
MGAGVEVEVEAVAEAGRSAHAVHVVVLVAKGRVVRETWFNSNR